MRFLYLLLISLLLLLGNVRAYAQLEVDLTVNPLSGMPGDTLTFQATLVNLGTDPLYINGVNLSGVPSGLTVDESSLYINFPVSPTSALNPGTSYSGDLFTVTLDPSLAPDSYSGIFTILGGLDATQQDNIADVSFMVEVLPLSAVPEPGGLLWLCGVGISGVGITARHLRRKCKCNSQQAS